ncbi:MAG: hypothetical protein K6E29_03265 [Cyanobacteria bacterium RUI128]|nr:hypothetical protein [Cyanobacteria bacterium RUI128]
MTSLVTGNYGYNPYLVDYYNNRNQNYPGLINPINTTPIFRPSTSPTYAPTQQRDNTEDGKDDGKIGIFGALKNIGKGVWNFITSPFKNEKGEWSLGSTLKSVLIAGAFIAGNVLTGGALTPILLATGAVVGGVGAVKAGYNIATATTDAEAEAAWQSMGSSAATLAATAVGARSYAQATAGSAASAEALANGATAEEAAQAAAGAASKYNGLSGIKNAVGKTFVDSWKNIGNAKTYLFGQSAQAATATTQGRPAVQGKLSEYYNTFKDAKNAENGGWLKGLQAVKDRAMAQVERFASNNSGVYKLSQETGNPLTTRQKVATFKQLRNSILDIAKQQIGYNANNTISQNALAIAKNPANIGIFTGLTSQTVVPDFYNMLNPQEQAYFNSLPADQQQLLIDQYYAVAA